GKPGRRPLRGLAHGKPGRGECPERASRFSASRRALAPPSTTMPSSSLPCTSCTSSGAPITRSTSAKHLDLRLIKHQEGSASRFTACRRPVTLVYFEEVPNRFAALARERQVKRWTRAKKEALVAGNLTLLKRL